MVTRSGNNRFVAKVSGFGFSSISEESGLVYLPRSIPWSAPEFHHLAFTFQQAKKTDIYSFGLVSMWLLFNEKIECLPNGLRSFGEYSERDKLCGLASQWLVESPDLNEASKSRLLDLFNCTAALDPQQRYEGMDNVSAILDSVIGRPTHPLIMSLAADSQQAASWTDITAQMNSISGNELEVRRSQIASRIILKSVASSFLSSVYDCSLWAAKGHCHAYSPNCSYGDNVG
jgi:serine/threonine protein kinase